MPERVLGARLQHDIVPALVLRLALGLMDPWPCHNVRGLWVPAELPLLSSMHFGGAVSHLCHPSMVPCNCQHNTAKKFVLALFYKGEN